VSICGVYRLSIDAPAAQAARLKLAGHLDSAAARDLLHAAADVVRYGCARLVVDLADLESYDEDAAYAVVGCCSLGRYLDEGVAVVTGSGAGAELVQQAGVHAQAHATGPAGSMASCPAC
jgi:hypothetical protein